MSSSVLVAVVIVEVMIGLSFWLRGQKARTVRDLVVVVVAVAVAVAIAVEVTMMTTMKRRQKQQSRGGRE